MQSFFKGIIVVATACTAASCEKQNDASAEKPSATSTTPATGATGATGTTGASGKSGTETPAASVGTLGFTSELSASFPEGLTVTAFPQAVDPTPGVAAIGTIGVSALALIEVCPPPPQPLTPGCTAPLGGKVDGQVVGPVGPLNPDGPMGTGGAGTLPNADVSSTNQHVKDKLKNAGERLNGNADECFDAGAISSLDRQHNVADGCFGFDYGIVSGTALGDVDPGRLNPTLSNVTDQSLAGVRSAILKVEGRVADAGNEACMVKTGRQMVAQASARVESVLKIFEGMLCQAKKSKIATALPEAGAALDLKAAFAKFTAATFSEASITRLADREGRAVYRSRLAFTRQGMNRIEPMTVTLVHSPGAEGNTAYDGVLWTEGERIDDQNGATYAVLTNISYERTGKELADQRLRMEIRNGEFNTSKVKAELIGKDGKIDLNAGAGADGSFGPGEANDYLEGARYFAFDVNPSTYAGKISFWTNPGGNYNEPARGFLFESAQNADGTLTGCAYAGAYREGSIRKAVREGKSLEPTGCFTPQLSYGACGSNGDNQGSQIWKQCFKQQGDGYYVVDTSNVASADGFDVIDLKTEKPALPIADAIDTGVGTVAD